MNNIKLVYIVSILLFISCRSENVKHEITTLPTPKKNATIESIMNRRSVRSYKSEQIKQAELDKILECGINAPSAKNLQPWAIRVIQSEDMINKLNIDYINYTQNNSSATSTHTSDYNILFGAPTFILIAGDTNNAYAQNDCGMLAQNMLLAAESMDIGTCVLGGIVRFINGPQGNDFRAKLDLPDNYQLFIGIVMGYKNEYPSAKPRENTKIKIIS
ncbi:MAG: nitroreductase [Bacteroidales bacterium]|nr:nitroreductase [Bacteroidales bacterium]